MSAPRRPGARLVYLDFEGTGTDVAFDRIVEFTFLEDGGEPWTERVNPGIPIPAEATAVHGISDADVAHLPGFTRFAERIQALTEGAVLVGYSSRRYDDLLLDAELRRAGQPGLPRREDGRLAVLELDLYALWQKEEPRTLVGAARRFAGVDLVDAHSAEADTRVLPQILSAMIDEFLLDGLTLEDLCARCVPDGEVDRDGKFKRREDGVVVFNFTQQKGRPAADHPDLLEWLLRRDFSAETKAVARAILEEAYSSTPDQEEDEYALDLPF